jgi:hypothetical protein
MRIISILIALIYLSISLNAMEVNTKGDYVVRTFTVDIYSETSEYYTEVIALSGVVIGNGVKNTHFVITTTGKTAMKNISIKVLTSPGSDILKLWIPTPEISGVTWSLYKMDGSLLMQNFLAGGESEIPFNNISNGVYILKVLRGPKILRNFKIEKK